MPRVAVKWWQDYVTILGSVVVPVATMIVSIVTLTRTTSTP